MKHFLAGVLLLVPVVAAQQESVTLDPEAMAELLIRRGFDAQRMFAIYNGVDFSSPRPVTEREAFFAMLTPGRWQIIGGHGGLCEFRVPEAE